MEKSNNTSKLKPGLFILVGVVLLAAVVGLPSMVFNSQNAQLNDLSHQINGLQKTIENQNTELKQLKMKFDTQKDLSQPPNKELWFWEIYDYPASSEALLETLKNAGNLIPFEGVLGGVPFFVIEEAKVLDPQFVYVPVEDGHVYGAMILKYEFNDSDKVLWQVVDGWWPEKSEN